MRAARVSPFAFGRPFLARLALQLLAFGFVRYGFGIHRSLESPVALVFLTHSHHAKILLHQKCCPGKSASDHRQQEARGAGNAPSRFKLGSADLRFSGPRFVPGFPIKSRRPQNRKSALPRCQLSLGTVKSRPDATGHYRCGEIPRRRTPATHFRGRRNVRSVSFFRSPEN